MIIMMIIVKQL